MIMSISESLNPPSTLNLSPSDTLRLELKAWEKSFAIEHQGRKASRKDIKQHPEIAQKYKLYAKLRSAATSQPPISSSGSPPPSSKRPLPVPAAVVHTPQKRAKHSHPPHPSAALLDLYDPPRSAQKTPPVQHRTSIGPTPQKDGRVLGLFDLLSPASNAGRTPSKPPRESLNGFELSLLRTPSKRRVEDDKLGGGRKLSSGRKDFFISPVDVSKRANTSALLTPTARRTMITPSKTTPHSRRALELSNLDETPAFLRRDSQHGRMLPDKTSHDNGLEYDDDDQAITWTPVKPRGRPRLAGKGLSALVRGLREMEEEKLDEELDILRELEDGGNSNPSVPSRKTPQGIKPFDIADSQIPDMPLGADGENGISDDEYDYLEAEKPGRGRGGEESKPWKKRGQKRTTRQVTMRPVKNRAAWKPEPKWKAAAAQSESDNEKEDKGGGDGIAIITETQITQQDVIVQELEDIATQENNLGITGCDSDFDAEMGGGEEVGASGGEDETIRGKEEEEEEGEEGRKIKGTIEKKDKLKKKMQKRKSMTTTTVMDMDMDKEEKRKKKVNSTAHANFRALKIRNKNSKGKSGGGRRFGRR